MGGVRHEAPLGVEGVLQAPEQTVDRVAELLELVARAFHGEPAVEALGGDLLGGCGHDPQRPQDPPGDEPAEHERQAGHERKREARGDQLRVEIHEALVFDDRRRRARGLARREPDPIQGPERGPLRPPSPSLCAPPAHM